MSENHSTFGDTDLALGHLLEEFPGVAQAGSRAPVPDEELSVFVEGKADALLGRVRKQQIMAQLSEDPDLYARWLVLFQLVQQDTTTMEVASKTRAVSTGFFGWLRAFLVPQVVYAAAFSLVLTVVVMSYLWKSADSTGPALVVQGGESLPEKANRDSVHPADISSGASEAIAQRMRCTAFSAAGDLMLCHSDTPLRQNWFVTRAPHTVFAVNPLVEADNVISLKADGALLLVEYKDASTFRLSLFGISLDGQRLNRRLLYEDQLSEGFFDELQLHSNRLDYTVNRPGLAPEHRRYDYDENAP